MFPAALVVIVGALTIIYLLNNSGAQFDSSDNYNMDYSSQVVQFAEAVANAEGFGLAGTIPTLANNPGDLVIPNWTGQKLGAEGISVFASSDEGWNRLKHQIQIIIDGTSHVYSLDDTISSMASKWTKTQQAAWASNVATYLSVSPGTTLREVLT